MRRAEREDVLRFYELGLSDHDGNFSFSNTTFPAKSLASIKAMLGHDGRMIDVAKMDVEGSEFKVFAAMGLAELRRVGQLQIEVHHYQFSVVAPLIHAILRGGLMLFNKEPNTLAARPTQGLALVEMAFVGPQHAFRSFATTHPSCGVREDGLDEVVAAVSSSTG